MSAMRKLGFLLLIAFTFYLPKLVSEGGLRPPNWALPDGAKMPLATKSVSAQEGVEGASESGLGPMDIPVPQVARQILPYEQFLRFDVTPQWVMQQFARVTILPFHGGQGMRVALITGTRENDLTGSLTYYFDEKEMVQRITISGATGGPGELVAFVTNHYELAPVAKNVYVRQHNGVVLAGLLVEPSRVIENGKPAGGCQVTLEINRPRNYAHVSQDFQKRLSQAAKP